MALRDLLNCFARATMGETIEAWDGRHLLPVCLATNPLLS
jgi:hypothetical protein